MKKSQSIFIKLLIPIVSITFILLLFTYLMVSRIYATQTKSSTISSSQEILKQTDTSLKLVHNHIAKTASIIYQTNYLSEYLSTPIDSPSEEWRRRNVLSNALSSTPSAMVDYELAIIGKNGLILSNGVSWFKMEMEDFFELPAFRSSSESGMISYGCLSSGFSGTSHDTPVIYGCKALSNKKGDIYGMILLIIQEESLRQFYQSFTSKSSDILLISSDGTIFSSTTKDDIGTINSELMHTAKETFESGQRYSTTKDGFLITSLYITQYDCYVVNRINSTLLLNDFSPRIQTFVSVSIFFVLLSLSLLFITRHELLPLQYLSTQMANATEIPKPVQINSCIEIEQIGNSYNQMIQMLNQYLDEITIAHERQRQNELDLLQMQINPHFLYNTLDSVKHLIEMNNQKQACNTLDSLISLLRSTLGKTNQTVSVAEEVANIKNYISIIGPRYGDLIFAEVHAEPICMDYMMPNLLLQPLVENAFFHAFQKTKSGRIHIFIYKSKGTLFCEIIDNGDGMTEEQVIALQHSKSSTNSVTRIGVNNVRERLNMLYPSNNSFEVVSEPGYGTSITLSFPAQLITSENNNIIT